MKISKKELLIDKIKKDLTDEVKVLVGLEIIDEGRTKDFLQGWKLTKEFEILEIVNIEKLAEYLIESKIELKN